MELKLKLRLIGIIILLLCQISTISTAADSSLVRKISLPKGSSPHYPFNNIDYLPPKDMKIGLVLSGGGARGFAHLGVLKALEEYNVPIDLIVGSSMGSVFGGFYAAGYSANDLIRIIKNIDWQEIFSDETQRSNLFWSQKTTPRRHILEVRFDKGIPYIPSSISSGQKIFDIIYSRLLRANFQAANNFDNLKIPFRAVATDLISGKRVVLSNGDLSEAISASSAVPLLFAPVEMDTMWLVDGGIRDNLPVDVAIENDADLTIAVDVSSPLRKPDQMKMPWQLADQVTTIMMREPTQESRDLADFLIKPQIGEHSAGEFTHIDSLIELGYTATIQKIDSIQMKLKNRRKNIWGENQYLGKIKRVKIFGHPKEELDSLLSQLQTREGRSLYLYDIYEDISTFYDAGIISNAYVLLKGEPHEFTAEFWLETNPIIREISIIHRNIIPDSIVHAQFDLPVNQTLEIPRLFSNLDSLINLYTESGYSLARIVSVSYEEPDALLKIKIDEGYIESLSVKGNYKTKDYIIKREFPLKERDIFKADLAIQGIRNIHSTGLFDRVTLNVTRDDTSNYISIKVKEKRYFLLRFGAKGSLERKGKVFLEFVEDNLLGREIKVSLGGAISDLEREAELNIFSVRLFNTLLTYRISAYYQERRDRFFQNFESAGDYLTIRRGLHFTIGQQIERLGSITAEFRMDGVNIYSDDPRFTFRDGYRIRSIAIRSVVDKRDKLPFPTKGIYNRWFWESGNQRILESTFGFTRFYIALEGYYPLFKRFNFHVKARGGSADLTLPFSEFFTMGGMDQFPGLYEREKFGRQLLHFGNELRYNFKHHLPIELYLGVNFNVGATWETSEDNIRKSDFLTGWGAYLAVNSIFGPIKLAYGNLVNHRELIYFSVGYDF